MVLPRTGTQEATMYHPDHMLQIAHTRERELVKEAEACGLPKADAPRPWMSGRVLAIAWAVASLVIVLRLVAG